MSLPPPPIIPKPDYSKNKGDYETRIGLIKVFTLMIFLFFIRKLYMKNYFKKKYKL